MRSELQSVLDSLSAMPTERLPELLGDLAQLQAHCMMRLSAPAPIAQSDCLLDVKEAAERLGISAQYLYRHSEQFPFTRREGRKLLFSSLGIDRYIAQKRR